METGEALDTRWRNLTEEAIPITVIGKWEGRCQGGGSDRSTVDPRAVKHAGRKGSGPVNTSYDQRRQGWNDKYAH